MPATLVVATNQKPEIREGGDVMKVKTNVRAGGGPQGGGRLF